ncbi:MAG: carbohydrate ABC transporter permease [Spirochaetaceae bacterium]|nr:carbohydrate ABC transporter permease [Spirochaetaceae bacterium]
MVALRKSLLRRRSAGDWVFDIVNVGLIVVLCATIVYPFMNQITLSVSNRVDVQAKGLHLFPHLGRMTIDSYQRVLLGGSIVPAFFWTVLRTVLGTSITVTVLIMMAYSLSKKYLPYRNFWTFLVVFTMFFSGGLVPSFLLIRSLGMMNTIWALVLPFVANAFSLIIARNFMMSVSEELAESARIDGANDVTILFRIYVPVSMPIIATLSLWSMVQHWNSWFDALIYIQRPPIQILQAILRRVLIDASFTATSIDEQMLAIEFQEYTPESLRAAILMVVTIPIVLTYPFFQRYFVKGIMIGSLKG